MGRKLGVSARAIGRVSTEIPDDFDASRYAFSIIDIESGVSGDQLQ
jgi:hypothetical protein